jgi:4-diphosphocytidyl-2-C-methyl-D-erythritol kinase
MVVFPNAKINLGLRVKAKRDDGYHELDTVFFPIPLTDVLEVITDPSLENGFAFSQTGLSIPGDASNNLCSRAYALLKKDHPSIPSVKVHLHKLIPMGAGMGGGSSDGAFMLRLINEKYNLDLDNEALKAYALKLGSDCPFFIYNQPCHARGRGELMDPIKVDLKNKTLVLVCPGIHISTAEAFANIRLSPNAPSTASIVMNPLETWKEHLINDFEHTVFPFHPELKEIKERLYENGAVYAAMSGSGSTIYGIFNDKAPVMTWPSHYQVFIQKI